MQNIDLQELSKRESERVEWKENVADINDVIRTAVAFANDYSNLGGGYIVCGAKETQDEHGFQKLLEIGLTSQRIKELEGKVCNDLREKVTPPIIPLVEEIPVSETNRILVFVIAGTGHLHSYRASGKDASTYYIRIGRETREAKNGLLRELLVRKNQIEPWDKRINNKASLDDIDLLILREYLKEMGLWDQNKALEDYLSDKEQISSFVPTLAAREKLTNNIRPRNFTILIFSSEPLTFFAGAHTIVSIYKGLDRSEPTAERHVITGNIVEQARKCLQILNTEAYTVFDKKDNIPNQIKYPLRALQESVINSLVHRDFESDQPNRITIFNDRIEILSPGTLPKAIDKDKFLTGKSAPFWRNQSLAYFFNKLQLAQAEGQGIPTIIRTMREEGCPNPIFEIGEESLTCILPAHPRHALIKNLHEIENEIILGKYDTAKSKLESVLKIDAYNYRAIDLLCEISNLLNDPTIVLKFITDNNIDLQIINPNTLINIAETISALKDNEKLSQIANVIMKFATQSSLEEKQIEKFVITFKRTHNDEDLIKFINRSIEQKPSLGRNVVLLENRARAKINLAKICIDTGKNPGRFKNVQIRARAWENARTYLSEAERDLNIASQYAVGYVEKDFIKKDIEFLNKLKGIAAKKQNNKYRRN